MLYPKLNVLDTSREMIDVFKGYNHNLRIGNGEFYEMTNLTSQYYPVLSPRPKRGVYAESGNNYGLISKDNLCYIDGENFVLNTRSRNIGLNSEPKTLISMGAYVIIMPDKKYVDTENFDAQEDFNIEAAFPAITGSAKFTLCKLGGDEYSIPEANIKDTAPAFPEGKEEYDDLTLWLDTSGDKHVLKQYSKTSSQWVSIATTYIKISFPNTTYDLKSLFSDNDGLKISGIKDIADTTDGLTTAVKEQLALLDNTMVVHEVGEKHIIVTGILDQSVTLPLSEGKSISIKRELPLMDFVIESGNRLWGCRYGVARNGEIVNEIYASKLGDFKNWNSFTGISTDSYVASVGTDGQFTGAITHLGYPIFFKENCMHKVYGNYPANYQIQTTACRGVQQGCSKSLAIVNETLYYKARSGICAYDGSLPMEISSALGDISYSNAVAGALNNKYYISMMDENEKYHLFVYDAAKGMWHREDNTHALQFCANKGDLYYIDGTKPNETPKIRSVRGSGTPDTTPVQWEAVTGIIGTDSPDKKYISRLDVRLLLKPGSTATFYAEYDSSEVWEHLHTMVGTTLKSFAVPIRPKRCDHLRLKITGQGDAKIYSICKTIEQGSDV
jgi:hypothetical protein